MNKKDSRVDLIMSFQCISTVKYEAVGIPHMSDMEVGIVGLIEHQSWFISRITKEC